MCKLSGPRTERLHHWATDAPTPLGHSRAYTTGPLTRLHHWTTVAPTPLGHSRAYTTGPQTRLHHWATDAPTPLGHSRAYTTGPQTRLHHWATDAPTPLGHRRAYTTGPQTRPCRSKLRNIWSPLSSDSSAVQSVLSGDNILFTMFGPAVVLRTYRSRAFLSLTTSATK